MEFTGTATRAQLGLGATYEGYDPKLLACILPLIDYIEVTPDTLAELHGDDLVLHAPTMAELKNAARDVQIVVHGVGLSIGSHDGYSERYIRLLDQFLNEITVAWHSEHLAYTMVDGKHLGTMLALPKTQEVLAMVSERVETIKRRYGLPFLLENIVHLLPDPPGDYSEATFLNALTGETGCGLILDVYNLECDAHNQAFDIPAFLDELDLSPVREIHVAGGVQYNGYMLDVHSRATRDSTIALAREVLDRTGDGVRVVTYELLREAVPLMGYDNITNELVRLRRCLQA